jgi:hypothetical protein
VDDDAGSMQLLAAGFVEASDAQAAERDLRAALDVEAQDVSISAVGGTPEFKNGYRYVLGGHIRAARVQFVESVVRRYGGEILTELPAAWAGVADSGSFS